MPNIPHIISDFKPFRTNFTSLFFGGNVYYIEREESAKHEKTTSAITACGVYGTDAIPGAGIGSG